MTNNTITYWANVGLCTCDHAQSMHFTKMYTVLWRWHILLYHFTALMNAVKPQSIWLSLPDSVYSYLIRSTGSTSQLNGLLKVHKQNAPLRPIVSCVSWATHRLSRLLANLLVPVVGQSSSLVRSSKHFTEFISQQVRREDEVIISLDVAFLFTCVPTDLAVQFACSRLEKTLPSQKDRTPGRWHHHPPNPVLQCSLSGVQREGVSAGPRHGNGISHFCSDCQSSSSYLSFPSPLLEILCGWYFHGPPLQPGAGVPQPPQQHRSMHPVHVWEGDRRAEATIPGCVSMQTVLRVYNYSSVHITNANHPVPALWLTPSGGTQGLTGKEIDELSQWTIIERCRMCGTGEERCGHIEE